MESSERSIEPTQLGAAHGDQITAKEEPGTAEQSIEENALSPEFNPNWRFYLAFASLAVVTLAVCRRILRSSSAV
jgi:ABC-type branched-subunit amino acid transport system permease subunit